MVLPGGGGDSEKKLRLSLLVQGSDFLSRLVEAIQATDDFNERVELLEQLIKEAAQVAGVSFEQIANAVRKLNKDFELFGGTTEKSVNQALRNLQQQSRDSFQTAGEAAESFRAQVDQVKQTIQDLASRRGASLADVGEGLRRAGTDSKVVTTSLRELNAELRKTREEGQKLTPEQALQRYRENVDRIKVAIQQLAERQNVTFRDAATAIRSAGEPAKETSQALRELEESSRQAEEGLSGLGRVAQLVFGGTLAFFAVRVVRDLVRFMGEATEQARGFARSFFQLEVAVRGLQRVGVDTTLDSFLGKVREIRGEFRLFTERELQRAIGELALYTREVGFTEEQVFELTEISAALATVTGRDVGETGFLIARALASGYTEALQRMGIAISRADITQRAMAEGLNKSFIQLTEQERATISLLLVQERVAPILEDLVEFLGAYGGRIDVAEEAQRTFTQTLGDRMLPLQTISKELLADLIDIVLGVANGFTRAGIQIVSFFIGPLVGVVSILEAVRQGATVTLADIQNAIAQGIQGIQDELTELNFGLRETFSGLGEGEFGMFSDRFEDAAEETGDLAADLQQRIAQEELRGQQRRIDLLIDFQRRVEQAIQDFNNKRAELERDLQDRLFEIAIRFAQRFQNLIADYAIRRAQINRQFDLREQEQRERFRRREIDEERKFQERLLRLQEDFLLNLQDAVRERDALAIIQATRRYNLERRQLIREFENRKQERRERFEDEIRDIERQRQERLRQLDIEHAERLRRLEQQRQLELLLAQREHERKLQEQLIEFELESEQRQRQFEQELEDLDRQIQNRLELVIQGWVLEGRINQENAEAIFQTLSSYFGPGGRIEGLYQYTFSLLQSLAQMAGISADLAQEIQVPVVTYTGETPDQGFQTGGTLIATRPTRAVFGEVPEIVTFTPLTGPNVGRTVGSVPAGLGGAFERDMQRVRVELMLSPDLVARTVDRAIGETAEVVFQVQRGRR